VVDGENADDAADYRPGSRAGKELGIRSPLKGADLTKAEVRALSRKLDLPSWNRPEDACLATRIPYNSSITVEKLFQVEAAEQVVRGLIPRAQARVRHHGDIARIEINSENLALLTTEEYRAKIVERFTELGFTYVTLDLQGYILGSLSRELGNGE
jgi:uncharacterized protein